MELFLIGELMTLSYYQFINILSFRIKVRMDSEFKSYTFKSESSNQFTHFNTTNFCQPCNSPTFKTSQRAESLPLKQKYNTISHLESFNQPLGDSRHRMHRIFDQNKNSAHQQSLSTCKKKRKSIFAKYDRGQSFIETEKASLEIPKQNHSQIFEESIKSPFQCKQLIEKKLAQRINENKFSSSVQIKQTMAIKERQIRYLKLEIERFKRCEVINKQNEDIYRRLTQKLKDRANESIISTTKKEFISADTPIHSLKQIKFTTDPSQSQAKQPAARQAANESLNTVPLKTIPENQENQLNTESKSQALPSEPADGFKTTSKRKDRRRRSPPKLFPIQREKDPIYLDIRQKINEHQSVFKRDINQVPLNYRLQEINRNLECNFNAHATRNFSRPHSKSSQKTRVNQSLKKSHYYIMMQ